MVLAIHGLTLHGRRYELLGRACAVGKYFVVAPDMRGFGRCYADSDNLFSTQSDCKRKIDYDRSYEDLASLAQQMKQKYPKLRLIVIGESLGAAMAVRLAGGHPELVDGLIISGPPMRIQPRMILDPWSVWQGLLAVLVRPSGLLHLDIFITKLISDNPAVIKEVSSDPLIRKHLTIGELLKTHFLVSKTRSYARNIKQDTPVLILQGNLDRCVIPAAIVDLSKNIRSADQTMRWFDNHSHLLLETSYCSGAVIAALGDWFDNHKPARLEELKELEERVRQLGGHIGD